ncbi:chain-length determining protein [Lactobacillus sp. Marseille-P7033]|nr:chain-length determining protein [Lactobacillus sp. Marseille-P7033]NGC77348.1 chain-length determining protein [Limosilactobacillus reuteri]
MKHKSFTLAELIHIFLKNLIVIILCAILGGALFFGIAKHKTSVTYSAERSIMIRNNLNSKRAYSKLKAELDMIPTYRDILESRQVMQSAREKLPSNIKKGTSAEDISNSISTNSHPNSLVISIKATTPAENTSIAYVNNVAKAAKKILPRVQPGVGDIYLYPVANSKNVDKKVHSSVKKYTLVGIALGIIAGMVISFTITSIKELN